MILHLFYVVKILAYAAIALMIVLLTPESVVSARSRIGGPEPIVLEKVVLFTMLFEVIGLGCGFGPLNNRFFPPMGSVLYWLRPNTIRLPPWPGRIPLTRGTSRTPSTSRCMPALLVMLVVALCGSGTGPIPEIDSTLGVLPAWEVAMVVALLAACGLRDKSIFLGARGEVYGSLAVAFLLTGTDIIVAAKLIFLTICSGLRCRSSTATSPSSSRR